jgi:hypothetical protein
LARTGHITASAAVAVRDNCSFLLSFTERTVVTRSQEAGVEAVETPAVVPLHDGGAYGEPEEQAERGGQGSPGEVGSVVMTATTTDAKPRGIAQIARARNR